MGGTVKKIVKPITSVFDPPQPKVPKITLPSPPSPSAAGKKVVEALPTEPPSRSDPAVQEEGAEVVRRRRSRGRASTIITALSGDVPAGSVVRKALLGGN